MTHVMVLTSYGAINLYLQYVVPTSFFNLHIGGHILTCAVSHYTAQGPSAKTVNVVEFTRSEYDNFVELTQDYV